MSPIEWKCPKCSAKANGHVNRLFPIRRAPSKAAE